MVDCRQYVTVDGSISAESPVISGVPQGTILGTLLFLIFISNINKGLISSTTTYFADGTRVIKPVSSGYDCEAIIDNL